MAALLLVLAVMVFLNRKGVGICLLKQWTGVPCLTCGASRAVVSMMRSNFRAAFLVQPLVTLMAPLALALGLVHACFLWFKAERLSIHLQPVERVVLLCVGVVLLVLNWAWLIVSGV